MAAEAATETATAEVAVGGAACPPAPWVGTRAVVVRETAGWAVLPAAAERLPLSAQTAAPVKRATRREEEKAAAVALAGAVSATSREARAVARVAVGGADYYRAVAWAATVVGEGVAGPVAGVEAAGAARAGATEAGAMATAAARQSTTRRA